MRNLTLKAALLASVTGMFGVQQSAGASEDSIKLDEIVVTARRQNESLQDVPATVSVLTSETLERTGAKVVADFVQLTSGVSISVGTTEPSDVSINIRGLNGVKDGENNVALIIDGVLRTSATAFSQSQGSLEQVEIMKGPQGAIYGRNASAGAIVITTKKPTDELSGEVKGSVANDNTYSVSGLLSGPIAEGVGFVLNAEYARSDGFYRNSFLPTALNQEVYPGNSTKAASIDNYRRVDVFGRLLFAPSDDSEIDIKAHYSNYTGGAITFNADFQIPLLAQIFDSPLINPDVNDHDFIFTNNTPSQSWQEEYGASVRATKDLDIGTLSGFVSYNKISHDYIAGGTSGAFGFFNNEPTCISSRAATAGGVVNQEPFETFYDAFGFAQPYSPSTCDGIQNSRRGQEDIVTELRLSSLDDGPLQWQFGASYIYINRRACTNFTLDTGVGGVRECFSTDPRFPTEALQDDVYKTDVYAVFGSFDYDVTDRLRAGIALRYDIEARKTDNNVPVDARTRWIGRPSGGVPHGTADTPANYFLNPGLDPAINPSGRLDPRSETFKQLQPKVTAAYSVNDDMTLFASWGIGFKAGGFNSAGQTEIVDSVFNAPVSEGGINAGLTIPNVFKKETTSAFEAGVKGRFGSVRYELAGYYTRVTDMQFFEFFVGDFGLLRSVSNIDKVRLYGGEASVNMQVTDAWSVFATANVIEGEIQENTARPYTVGNKSPSTPDYTINFGTQIIEPLTDNIEFNLRADVRVTGPTEFHTVQDNTVPTTFGVPANFANSTRSTFTIVNLRAGFEMDGWSVTAFARNLFDTKYLEDVVMAPEFGGNFLAAGSQRRRFGVEATFKF